MTTTIRTCARKECGKPVRTAYRIAGVDNVEYCSRGCLDIAFNEFIKGRRKASQKSGDTDIELAEDALPEPDHESDSETIAKEFGNASIVRHICDRPGCGKPVTLNWKGRNGEYCSNKCLKLAERQGESVMTNATEEVQEDVAPVTGPAPKKAKAAKKKAVVTAAAGKSKKVKTTKAAAAASNGNGRNTINVRRVIKLTKKASQMRAGTKRQIIYEMLKTGMTVRDLQEAAIKKFKSDTWMGRSVAILRVCEEMGLCTVSNG